MSTFRQKKPIRQKKPFRRQTLTIGIAALCTRQEGEKEYGVIIGAADRLITIGQGIIAYEAIQKKIHMLTPLIVAIPSGSTEINIEVVKRTQESISKDQRIVSRSVYDVADLYSQKHEEYIKEIIEKTVLYPRNLNWEDYNNFKYDRDPTWFINGKIDVFGEENPTSEIIIAGIDEQGPAIYNISKGWTRNENHQGFTTVGIGGEHARLEFIIGNHSSSSSYTETLLLTYIAKQRANLAAHVGKDTDLFSISLKDGYTNLSKELELLTKIHNVFLLKQEKDKYKLYTKVRGII